jgi:hypothetical protein
MATLRYELTDTFNGEANYSWVKRGVISEPKKTDRGNIRYIKSLLGITARHKTENFGDTLRLTFPGDCIVLFIFWE